MRLRGFATSWLFARIGIMRAFNILALQLEAGAFLGSFPS